MFSRITSWPVGPGYSNEWPLGPKELIFAISNEIGRNPLSLQRSPFWDGFGPGFVEGPSSEMNIGHVDAVRAKKPARLPTVLSIGEVRRILEEYPALFAVKMRQFPRRSVTSSASSNV